MLRVQSLIVFAASTRASMIVSRMVPRIRPRSTQYFDATERTSRISKMIVSRPDSLLILQEKEESCDHKSICDNQRRFGPRAAEPGLLRERFPAFPWHLLPNWLTYCRCAAIPMLIVFYYSSIHNMVPSGIFAAASVTDYFDGYLARRWDISSDFGAFLDPVADKLMVSTALILLAGRYGAIVAIPTCIILAREIAVSALREWMAGKGLRNLVQVGFQVPSTGPRLWMNIQALSLLLLYLSTIVTVTSGSLYFRAAAPYLYKESRVDLLLS